ncbi:ABC transporter permease subunit [Actinoplanes sp. NPDC051346]|uniref:ABC transporter permease subunit n=1 Tax=Actinoplanes sp. NPDC051346 TaxID=3155048 RepID=UPI003432EF56
MNLVRAELLKIRTTNTWWIFGIVTFVLWILAVLWNWGESYQLTQMTADGGLEGDGADQIVASADPVNIASTLYTSGQFLGLLMVLMLATIVVTNEYFHQTATTTFLLTPRREAVVLAKLVASVILGLIFWLVTTVLNLIAAPILLTVLKVDLQLGEPAVWRAIGLNGLAYALWAILGVGAGILIRSQLGATITLSSVYVIGTFGTSLLFFLLTSQFGEGINKLQVLVPTMASDLMVSGKELPGSPPQWVGVVVLIGYALIAGVLGTWIAKRRDVS